MSLKSSCVNAWNLDGNSNDSAGSNNGTDVGVTYSALSGAIGQAATYNGSATTKVTCMALGSNDFTFVVRLKRNSLGTQYFLGAINSLGQNVSANILIYFNSSDQLLFTAFSGASAVISIGTATVFNSTSNWYNVVFRRNGNTFDSKINNTNISSGSYAGALNNPAGGFGIGCGGDYATLKFNGYIDYVNYFNSYLSDADLTTLYNSGNGMQYPFSNSNMFLAF